MLESQEQSKFFDWITWVGQTLDPRLLFAFHIPNGEKRDIRIGVKLKRMGVKRGVLDVQIPIRTNKFTSLWLEFKKEKEFPTPEQILYMKHLSNEGALCCIVYSADEAIKIVKEYLNER